MYTEVIRLRLMTVRATIVEVIIVEVSIVEVTNWMGSGDRATVRLI